MPILIQSPVLLSVSVYHEAIPNDKLESGVRWIEKLFLNHVVCDKIISLPRSVVFKQGNMRIYKPAMVRHSICDSSAINLGIDLYSEDPFYEHG